METLRAVSHWTAYPGIETSSAENMPDYIIDKVSAYFSMTRELLTSRSRKRDVVFPRQIAMTLLAKHTTMSLTAVGYIMGGYDHATVIHAKKTVTNLTETDRKDRETVKNIEVYIKSAGNLTLQCVLDMVHDKFQIAPTDLLKPVDGNNSYNARCAVIYIMRDCKQLSDDILCPMFNCDIVTLKESLKHHNSLCYDMDYYKKVESIRKQIKINK